uniref:Uncharacterized protein n=1 Tax=Arundo donax TaxID=35708 RepID=A0A0A9FNY5_ARUDO
MRDLQFMYFRNNSRDSCTINCEGHNHRISRIVALMSQEGQIIR